MNIQLLNIDLTTDVYMILRSLCRLSLCRPIQYSIGEKNKNHDHQILIVDGESEDSVANWLKYTWAEPSSMSVLINSSVSHEDKKNTYTIERKQVGVGLLKLLDNIANKIAAPELVERNHNYVGSAVREKTPLHSGKAAMHSNWNDLCYSAKDQSGYIATALVIDDSPSVRLHLSEFLRKRKIRVDVAASAEEGILKARNHPYDIIFLDVVMPGIDGYLACKILKREPKTKSTPVVMLTSKSSTFNKVRGLVSGCDTYLIKPVKQGRLSQVLDGYLVS